MLYFEQWYNTKGFNKKVISADLEVLLLREFCSASLVRPRNFNILDCYLDGKKQREISILFNIQQPYVSFSINLTRRIMKIVHTFLYHEETGFALEVAKSVLTPGEYKVLNYRLVGYPLHEIAKVIQTSTPYVCRTNKRIMAKFEKHIMNDRIKLLHTYLKKINAYWKFGSKPKK